MCRVLSGSAPFPAVCREIEQDALEALRAAHPELAGNLAPALERARAAGLGKLWTALARERLGGVRPEVRGGRAVLRLPDGSELIAPPAVMDAFADHQPGLTAEGPGGPIDHPAALLAVVAAAAPLRDATRCEWEALAGELAESVANHALALVGETWRRRRLGLGNAGVGGTGVCEHLGEGCAGAPGALRWAAERAAADPGFSPLAVFEQSIVDGHPLHPCAKIRGGMSTGDLFTYAPEWVEEMPVGIVAVAASACSKPSVPAPSTTDLLHRWHPHAAGAARSHLEQLGVEPDDYVLLPAHPWQILRTLPARHADALADGRVVIVPGAGIAARPLLAFRTFAPAPDRRAPHLKTAVDVRLTTAVRIVSPPAARNGPLVSELVARACEREHGFGGRFAALAELTGCSFVPAPGEEPGLAASLAAVLRESPEHTLGPCEIALPTAALAARSPTTGRPLLSDVLDDLSRAHSLSLPEAGARFLEAWCDCALPPLLTLLSSWGIGLEPHGENLITVLRDGLPVRVLYRDFGGIRISPSRLAARGLHPRLTGALPTDDEGELHTKFLFPLIETNLGQMVATLVRVGGCDRQQLWDLVAACAREAFASLAARGERPAQVRSDEEAFFAPTLQVKAMLRTQLSGTPHNAQWVAIANPLG